MNERTNEKRRSPIEPHSMKFNSLNNKKCTDQIFICKNLISRSLYVHLSIKCHLNKLKRFVPLCTQIFLWLFVAALFVSEWNLQQKCRWVKVFSKKFENRGYIECLSFDYTFFFSSSSSFLIASVVTSSFRLFSFLHKTYNNSYLCCSIRSRNKDTAWHTICIGDTKPLRTHTPHFIISFYAIDSAYKLSIELLLFIRRKIVIALHLTI